MDVEKVCHLLLLLQTIDEAILAKCLLSIFVNIAKNLWDSNQANTQHRQHKTAASIQCTTLQKDTHHTQLTNAGQDLTKNLVLIQCNSCL
ncbi:Hypothetical predicted protein [Octopus vulgaris]|uniref:Uncharacterized protein n=1 Tax=Octopus vulgaris TaxID=6645 RepID=A0AA36FCD6_OCTVU|nr:Hypothetical predicted protein [Octopus vulgaris]